MSPAAGLGAIFFILTLVCWTIWTGFFILFASHYVLTTLSDSSSGQDEVHYPNEHFMDWWWKPLLFFCVLLPFLLSATLLLAPLGIFSIEAFAITWVLILWFLYPLGLASALYTQNWFHIAHLGVIGRMLRHFGAFVYVYLMTLGLSAGAVWLFQRAIAHSLVWAVPAIVCLPAALLLYARHWGRFAWLSLNHLPRQGKAQRHEKSLSVQAQPDWPDGDLPPLPVEKAKPSAKQPRKKAPAGENDEADTDPYTILDDPVAPGFEETPVAPAPPKPAPAPAAHMFVEEEDEWATDKKPYNLSEPDSSDALPADAPPEAPAQPDRDKPLVLSQYFDERKKKEQEQERKAEETKRTLPALSKKTPTFRAALLSGVWNYLFYYNTLQIWGNLVIFTMVELFLMYMLVAFMPRRPE